jgi:hypothetical protein
MTPLVSIACVRAKSTVASLQINAECHHGIVGHRHCHRQLVELPVVGILFRLALEKCLAIIVDMRLGASPELWRLAAGGGGKKRGGWWGG